MKKSEDEMLKGEPIIEWLNIYLGLHQLDHIVQKCTDLVKISPNINISDSLMLVTKLFERIQKIPM